jgi:hypothetical protein
MLSEFKKLSMIMSCISCSRCCLSCWKVESIAYSLKLGALGPAAFVLIKVGGFRPGSLCAHTLKSLITLIYVVDWYHMHMYDVKLELLSLHLSLMLKLLSLHLSLMLSC